jgi:hypothetical protein
LQAYWTLNYTGSSIEGDCIYALRRASYSEDLKRREDIRRGGRHLELCWIPYVLRQMEKWSLGIGLKPWVGAHIVAVIIQSHIYHRRLLISRRLRVMMNDDLLLHTLYERRLQNSCYRPSSAPFRSDPPGALRGPLRGAFIRTSNNPTVRSKQWALRAHCLRLRLASPLSSTQWPPEGPRRVRAKGHGLEFRCFVRPMPTLATVKATYPCIRELS